MELSPLLCHDQVPDCVAALAKLHAACRASAITPKPPATITVPADTALTPPLGPTDHQLLAPVRQR